MSKSKRRRDPYPLHSQGQQLSTFGLNDANNPIVNNIFLGKPFYCWDTEFLGPEKRNCCFNHMIFLPEKDGIPKPLFPYEKDVYNAWQQHMHLWIKKSTGLGISEFFLRLMVWLCLKDNALRGCQMCIVTGPNIDLAKKLIKRMRDLIIDYPGFKFATMTDYVLEINKCWIQAYPSHNLGSFRSLDRPKMIFLDEADFFPVGQLEEIRHVSERYIAKSNPWIVMVSTPNNPNGLFEQIELEPEETCLYKRMFLDYKVGEGLIYTPKELEKAKQSPGFEREYNLKYGWSQGNVFLPRELDLCSYHDHPVPQVNPACSISCGVDPGFGSSRFAVTIIMLESDILKVIYSKEFEKASYEEMLSLVSRLKVQYRPQKIYVDASRPDFIKSLKGLFREAQDYDRIIAQAKADKIDPMYRLGLVIPISFNEWGKELLGRFQHFVSKGWFSISAVEHKELVTQMRMARFNDKSNLDKEETSGNTFDSFDAARLALVPFHTGAKGRR